MAMVQCITVPIGGGHGHWPYLLLSIIFEWSTTLAMLNRGHHFTLYCMHVVINSTWKAVNLLFIACRLSYRVDMYFAKLKTKNEWRYGSAHIIFFELRLAMDVHTFTQKHTRTQAKIYWCKRLLLEMVRCVTSVLKRFFSPLRFCWFWLFALIKWVPQQLFRTSSGISRSLALMQIKWRTCTLHEPTRTQHFLQYNLYIVCNAKDTSE